MSRSLSTRMLLRRRRDGEIGDQSFWYAQWYVHSSAQLVFSFLFAGSLFILDRKFCFCAGAASSYYLRPYQPVTNVNNVHAVTRVVGECS